MKGESRTVHQAAGLLLSFNGKNMFAGGLDCPVTLHDHKNSSLCYGILFYIIRKGSAHMLQSGSDMLPGLTTTLGDIRYGLASVQIEDSCPIFDR